MKAGELLGAMLLSEVNIAYYQALTAGARAASRPGGSPSSTPPPRPGGTGATFCYTQIRSPGDSRDTPATQNRIIQGKMRSARCHLRGDPPWPSA
jgi:hypothetical protein